MSANRALFFFVVTALSGLVVIYPFMRLWSVLMPDQPLPWSAGVLLFLAPVLVRLIHTRASNALTRLLSATVMTWIGISFLGFSLLLPTELLIVAGLVDEVWIAKVILAALTVLAGFALYNAHPLHVTTLTVDSHQLATGTRLVQISDLHLGSRQPGLMRRVVAATNALNPDFVLLTGDIVDMHGITEAHLSPLKSLTARVLFCIGNHERYIDREDICDRLRNCGVHVLRNSTIDLDPIQFLGIDDAEMRDQVAKEITKITPIADRFRILLYHRPDGAEAAAAWGAGLMLTGHTHHGQLFPFNFLVKRVFPRLYRDYQVDGMTLYVSSGTGTWGPVMRLGSKCEITLIELL